MKALLEESLRPAKLRLQNLSGTLGQPEVCVCHAHAQVLQRLFGELNLRLSGWKYAIS
jgi:hypothetical protein